MAIICSALNTEFTPAVGDFHVQTVGEANLMRKNASGTGFILVDTIRGRALICSNPIASTVYRFDAVSLSPTVEAAQ